MKRINFAINAVLLFVLVWGFIIFLMAIQPAGAESNDCHRTEFGHKRECHEIS